MRFDPCVLCCVNVLRDGVVDLYAQGEQASHANGDAKESMSRSDDRSFEAPERA